jgi:ABC-2 type transport system permease protein
MRDALHAEWTKLRTLTSTGWLVGATAALTVGVSTAVVAASRYSLDGGYQDLPKLALVGIDLGQAVVVILAVLAVSNEYGTGMMRTTLAAVPRRLVVLAAKAINLVGLVVVSGVVAVAGCLLAGRLILPGRGFTFVHGYTLLSLAQGPTVRAAVGSVLYLVLIALLSLGVATAVRDSATAMGLVLGLLYLWPLFDQVVISNPIWHRRLERVGPMTAGLAIQATTNLKALPITPWAGLGVLAAWAGAAVVMGAAVFRYRDA